ncbi:MAG TPA: DNRLRE domain-containing protein [Myxococcales bacterium]|nr:DNRLRE domain-containing protein [Myxococcales bacterium]
MPLLMAWPAFAAAALATGQVTVTFRDGESPTPAYAGTRDVSVWDDTGTAWQPDVNYDGVNDQLGGGADSASALLKFDLSGVPPSTAIRGGSLQLYVWSSSGGEVYPAYQCLRPWTSTGATWNSYDGANGWTVSGATGAGDRAAVPAAALSTTTTGPAVFPLTDAGVALAQAWIAGSTPNNGFVLQEYANTYAMNLESFGSPTPANWPTLSLSLADGGTRTISSGWDTTIANARDPRDFNNNGGSLNADGNPLAALLIAFDVSLIPPWSTVTAASLLFHCGDGTLQPYAVYEALRPWSETEASWNSYATGFPWAAPGADGPGDHGGVSLGTLTGINSVQTVLNPTGVALVQSWVRGGANRGLEIVEYSLGGDGIWCEDREDPQVPLRPGLQVTYAEGQLSFASLPASGGIGAPLGPFTLQRKRLDGVPINTGAPALFATATASSPTAAFAGDPSASTWSPSWSVRFPAGSAASDPFWLKDPQAGQPSVTVAGGAPWQAGAQVESVRKVRFSVAASTAPAGSGVSATVQAVDSADVSAPVDLAARLLGGTGAAFSATSIGTAGGAQVSGIAPGGSATFTVHDDRAETIQVCASISSATASEACSSLSFAPGAPDHLSLVLARAGATIPIQGCAPEDLVVQLEDNLDNPVSQPAQVTLCADVVSGITLGASTLGGESRAGGCVSGALGPGGGARLTVAPTTPVGVNFSASSPAVSPTAYLGVQWIAGPPSLVATGLAPRDTPPPLVLTEAASPAYVRITPRDDCGFLPLTAPIDVVIPAPLVAGPPQLDADAGTVDVPIAMPVCSATTDPILIRATVNGRLLVDQGGSARSVPVEPHCPLRVEAVGCNCASSAAGGPVTLAVLLALALAARPRRSAGRRL